MQNIFISCGEVSGDIYAGDFIRELLKLRPDLQSHIWGMMGPEGEKSGGHAKWSYEELKLMGILEVIPALPRLLCLKNDIVREIVRLKPDAVVLIDNPDFNLLLAKSARKSGYTGKIISLIPPTVWAWRAGRVRNLRRDFDLCLPLFAFEHKFLLDHNVNSLWKAHPLVHDLSNVRISDEFRKKFHPSQNIIALMPGSRRYDIRYHLEILLDTAKILRTKNFLPVFSIAPGLTKNLADELRERVKISGFDFWEGKGRELMLGARAAAGVSGTVAVEAMLLERYMVVIYNMKRINYEILKRLVRVKNISIPNFLTSQPVYPELLCGDAKPENIINALEDYLFNEENQHEIRSRLHEAKSLMGTDNAAEFWAESVVNIL